MGAGVRYTGGERFRWRKHWWQWRKVWCHLWGHRRPEKKTYALSYFAKVSGNDWQRVKDTTPVDYCGFCRTVFGYDVHIAVASLEKKIAHVQVLEMESPHDPHNKPERPSKEEGHH